MEKENFIGDIVGSIVDTRTTDINDKTIARIDAVVEMCESQNIKPTNEDGTPNYPFVKLIGQNKAVMDDFATGFWLKKKAQRLEEAEATNEEVKAE